MQSCVRNLQSLQFLECNKKQKTKNLKLQPYPNQFLKLESDTECGDHKKKLAAIYDFLNTQ